LLVGLIGVAVIWRQLDDAAWERWMRQTSGLAFAARIAAGIVMVGVAAAFVLSQERGLGGAVDVAAATGIALVGIALILGPWISKLLGDLSAERRERVRSQERADVAAHLHDSVLQTLALLQKNANDPAAVATLARRQERDLRAWLYGDDGQDGDSLLGFLRSAAAEIEEAHHVEVEVVGVGDAALDPDTAALARAAREAMVNAAKHARAGRVDVYVECDGRTADVFVRDRGVGFDLDQVGEDRHGLRGSIIGRVERHGGTVRIRTGPGEGTEVTMSLPLRSPSQEAPA
jgi:signal transduction histidine kinase